jgi:hydroxymethylpyrimidine/phosphomethylpyrimidine kinase
MGNVIPDRFFWALPPGEEGDLAELEEGALAGEETDALGETKASPRRVH